MGRPCGTAAVEAAEMRTGTMIGTFHTVACRAHESSDGISRKALLAPVDRCEGSRSAWEQQGRRCKRAQPSTGGRLTLTRWRR